MPKILAVIAGLWVGYIDGAGIGAGLIELLPGQETMEVSKVLLVSLLMGEDDPQADRRVPRR
jgi:hypothetical protein